MSHSTRDGEDARDDTDDWTSRWTKAILAGWVSVVWSRSPIPRPTGRCKGTPPKAAWPTRALHSANSTTPSPLTTAAIIQADDIYLVSLAPTKLVTVHSVGTEDSFLVTGQISRPFVFRQSLAHDTGRIELLRNELGCVRTMWRVEGLAMSQLDQLRFCPGNSGRLSTVTFSALSGSSLVAISLGLIRTLACSYRRWIGNTTFAVLFLPFNYIVTAHAAQYQCGMNLHDKLTS